MSNKKILAIKDYHNNGGDLKIEVEDFKIERLNQILVSRIPDQYSSRLGMMANLNKNSRSLSWGFTEMIVMVDEFSDQGAFISHKVYVFSSIGVEQLLTLGSYEVITFAFNKKSEFCFGQC